MRICKGCAIEKSLDHYHTFKKRNGSKAHYYKCKECHKEYSRKWIAKDGNREKRNKRTNEKRKANPELQHQYKLKARYGLTIDQFNKMREEQNFSCCICKEHESLSRHEQLHVDHCHKTGKVRGLLCHLCNVGLAKFKDNSIFLENAFNYLRINTND